MKNLLFAFLLAMPVAAFAQIIHIPEDYSTIEQGINASQDGDTILISPGTYAENISFDGKDITVASKFLTTNDSSYISETILDGQQMGRVVSFTQNETQQARLTGLVITNGNSSDGSGIYINNASPTINHNIIENNHSEWYGTGNGIYMKNSSANIANNTIRSHYDAIEGSGIFIESCDSATIKGNRLSYNETMSGYGVAMGAGMYIKNSDEITIKQNLFYRNKIDVGWGDMIAVVSSNVLVQNCTFYNTSTDGCHFHVNQGALEVQNSIVWADPFFEGTNFDTLHSPAITIKYSNFKTLPEFAIASISTDPCFRDEKAFELSIQSPCINTGNPESTPDPDGSRADMGWKYCSINNYGTIEGQIELDTAGLANMQNVWVSTENQITFTQDSGSYALRVLPGTHNLNVNVGHKLKESVQNINIQQGEVLIVDFDLTNIQQNGVINVQHDGLPINQLQHAIRAAVPNDEIVLHDGTYNGSFSYIDKPLTLGSEFMNDGDTAHITNTIIDGEDTYFGLQIHNVNDSNVNITGLTIQNGFNDLGGGVYARASHINFNHIVFKQNEAFSYHGGAASIISGITTFSHCQFHNNKVGGGLGGALYIRGGEVKINHCNFTENIACTGGGIYITRANSHVLNSFFIGNQATNSSEYFVEVGGGVALSWQTDTTLFMNNVLTGNEAIYEGDAVYNSGLYTNFLNNTIVDNNPGSNNGLYLDGNVNLYNNIIWNNAGSAGAEVMIYDTIWNPCFYNCDISGGEEAIRYQESSSQFNGIMENIMNSDPLFAEGSSYQLSGSSPCIDQGAMSIFDSLDLPETDIAGNSRIYNDVVDIGAYEWQIAGINNFTATSEPLLNRYPNPFSKQLNITFKIAHRNYVSVQVYNAKGQFVQNLAEKYFEPGTHKLTWDGNAANGQHLENGIFFIKMNIAGRNSITKPVLLAY